MKLLYTGLTLTQNVLVLPYQVIITFDPVLYLTVNGQFIYKKIASSL